MLNHYSKDEQLHNNGGHDDNSPTHYIVAIILKNYNFHDSLITVHCNEWDENQPILWASTPFPNKRPCSAIHCPFACLSPSEGQFTILISEPIVTNSFTLHRTGSGKAFKRVVTIHSCLRHVLVLTIDITWRIFFNMLKTFVFHQNFYRTLYRASRNLVKCSHLSLKPSQ